MSKHTSTALPASAPESIFGHVHRMPWEERPVARPAVRPQQAAAPQRDLVTTA